MSSKKEKLRKILTDAGVGEKESLAYLSLLELGEAPASDVAQESGLKRPTAYTILERLAAEGLVGKSKQGHATFYRALNPYLLLEDRAAKLAALRDSLPALGALQKRAPSRPQMTLYQGFEGLRAMMEDTLATKGDIFFWADMTLVTTTVFHQYWPVYIRKRVARSIWARGILTYDARALEFKRRGGEELREAYLISPDDFPLRTEINIYNDKVAIISHEDLIGVIVQNPNIADTQRSIFKLCFGAARAAEPVLLRSLPPLPLPGNRPRQ